MKLTLAIVALLVLIAALADDQLFYGSVRVVVAPCQTNVVFANVGPHFIIESTRDLTNWYPFSEHWFYDGRPRFSFSIPVSSNEQAAYYRVKVPTN